MAGVAGAAFFAVGASRSPVTYRSWYVDETETLAVSVLAATVGFTVGTLLEGLACFGPSEASRGSCLEPPTGRFRIA